MDRSTIDILWLIVCSALVFLMQAGFLCLETGLTRNKNNINVAIKNLVDFATSTLLFWLFGFAFMFGATQGGFIGTSRFVFDFSDSGHYLAIFFIFQAMFCGTAVTIVSGAVAERLRFFVYILFALLVAGFVYPIFGHWVWYNIDLGQSAGWLGQMGFIDFAGSTVVHSVGGWASLAILLVIGPRVGRFPKNGSAQNIIGANIPIAALGTLFLFLGWMGFNGGSNLRVDGHIATIIINTLMAGAAGAIAPTLFSIFWDGVARVDGVINGILAGLVSVTAACLYVSTPQAVLIGFIGGIVMSGTSVWLERLKIDDAVGAIPAHLTPGIWGTLSVGFFGNLGMLDTGLSRPQQIGVQLLGIVVCAIWTFGLVYLFTLLLNRLIPLRVTPQEELDGLNLSEHGVNDPWLDLIEHMDRQLLERDWTEEAPIEMFTEAGRVAMHYNQVLQALNQTIYRANAIVDRAMDGIITFAKHDLTISTFNPAAELIFGFSEREILTQPITNLLRVWPGADAVKADAAFKTFEPLLQEAVQVDYPIELTGLRADGERFPVEITLAETEDGDTGLYIGTFRDITMRKQAREDLEMARDAAESANRSKSAFLANMSHELRTPLNAVIGYSEILIEDARYSGQHQLEPDLEKIQTAGRHLLDLINNVLDLSKIEAGHTELYVEEIDLKLLVMEIKVTMQPLVERNGNFFDVYLPDEPIRLRTDVVKLKQVIINLISNAAKFTQEGSVMLSCVTETIDDTPMITFYISDTGIGISSSEIGYLFEPFTQADISTTRQYGGTGLGLAITKRFCEMLGGSIRVDSELGRGSTFAIQIPASFDGDEPKPAPKTAAFTPPAYHDTLPERRKIVLVIDDDEASLGVIEHHLIRQGFHVETATSGVEGLLKAKQILPDLITLDVQMPEIDGWMVLTQLKQNPDLKRIPVVLLTISDDKDKGFTLGASDFLTKPIQKSMLLESVNRFARPSGESGEAPYILIVEDDVTMRDVIERTLVRDGWAVVSAENGRLAIEALQDATTVPSLIILDLMMPEVDGFMFVDIVRLNSRWSNIPIVVVTAKELTNDDRDRLNGGVTEILQKNGREMKVLIGYIRSLVESYAE